MLLPTVVRWGCLVLAAICAWLPAAHAQNTVREQEIAQCRPGEIMRWEDGKDHMALDSIMVFLYEPAGAPPWFGEREVLAALQRAAAQWSRCGVSGRAEMATASSPSGAGVVRVRWSDVQSGGNAGIADYGRRILVLGPAVFQLLRTRNPKYDGRETLQMVISHEMGHLFGLVAHSRRCVDVTSNYKNAKGESCYARDMSQLGKYPEYRSSLPTACDIQRCRMANGLPLLPQK